MNIAYVSIVPPNRLGAFYKVNNQMDTWRKLGHLCTPFFITETKGPNCYRLWKRGKALNPQLRLLFALYRQNPDVIYMRENHVSIFFQLLLLFFAKRIVLEINGNSVIETALDASVSIKKRFYHLLMRVLQPRSISRVLGCVCVTRELHQGVVVASQQNSIISPNSVPLKKDRVQKSGRSGHPCRLLFLGSPKHSWHGVDKLVALAKGLGGLFHIHVVGPSLHEARLDADICPTNMTFHGYLEKEQIEQLVPQMDIGIGSCALHRKDMYEACPLKVRDYLAYGLPLLLPYLDTAFVESAPDWVLTLPNVEDVFNSSANVESVRRFCENFQGIVLSDDDIAEYVDSHLLEESKLKVISSWVNDAKQA
ncbi:hypothetical protein N1030_13770 [Desulfovibrio mangrovi]|uniref:hypothetical protein n=1 Tax=Desulfovibrio mangrovi TaxID=2976983 RepID=UPI0022465837|nr:hypothetical protein [Desulfovibrio mangrovi]UZP66668.1 hypothetical protein N1030_13770 [Desulfovibrio mangrovi]